MPRGCFPIPVIHVKNTVGKDELLWASPQVTNFDDWVTYCGTLSPAGDYPYLTLVADPGTETTGVGFLFLDNFGSGVDCD